MHLLKRTVAKREELVWRARSNPRLAFGSGYVMLKAFCRERRMYRIDEGFIAIDIFDFLFQIIYGHIEIPERKRLLLCTSRRASKIRAMEKLWCNANS
jgi:hypothetical protein